MTTTIDYTDQWRGALTRLANRRNRVNQAYADMIDETAAAVATARHHGVPVADIAHIFGVDRQQVYKWLRRRPVD